MQFAEAEESWGAIPLWIQYLLWIGFRWQRDEASPRRLALISLPCPSAGAAVVALGAMIRSLSSNGANDIEAHFKRLQDLAKRGGAGCLLRRGRKRTNYIIEKLDPAGPTVWAAEVDSKSGLRVSISRRTAPEWSFVGEAPVSVSTGEELEFVDMYTDIACWPARLLPQNLTQTDSGICFAGSAVGESEARSRAAMLRFRLDDRTADLSQLLTIQSWTPRSISRMTYFNCRTDELDRTTASPRVVIADGDKAFLRVLGKFRESDIVGVVDRTLDRARLEELGQALADLGQWYVSMPSQEEVGIAVPPGIATRSWMRR